MGQCDLFLGTFVWHGVITLRATAANSFMLICSVRPRAGRKNQWVKSAFRSQLHLSDNMHICQLCYSSTYSVACCCYSPIWLACWQRPTRRMRDFNEPFSCRLVLWLGILVLSSNHMFNYAVFVCVWVSFAYSCFSLALVWFAEVNKLFSSSI